MTLVLGTIFDCVIYGIFNMTLMYFYHAGVFLPNLCESQRSNPHRAMSELLSSGVALGPIPAAYPPTTTASAPSA
jgi:hypothetical protein